MELRHPEPRAAIRVTAQGISRCTRAARQVHAARASRRRRSVDPGRRPLLCSPQGVYRYLYAAIRSGRRDERRRYARGALLHRRDLNLRIPRRPRTSRRGCSFAAPTSACRSSSLACSPTSARNPTLERTHREGRPPRAAGDLPVLASRRHANLRASSSTSTSPSAHARSPIRRSRRDEVVARGRRDDRRVCCRARLSSARPSGGGAVHVGRWRRRHDRGRRPGADRACGRAPERGLVAPVSFVEARRDDRGSDREQPESRRCARQPAPQPGQPRGRIRRVLSAARRQRRRHATTLHAIAVRDRRATHRVQPVQRRRDAVLHARRVRRRAADGRRPTSAGRRATLRRRRGAVGGDRQSREYRDRARRLRGRDRRHGGGGRQPAQAARDHRGTGARGGHGAVRERAHDSHPAPDDDRDAAAAASARRPSRRPARDAGRPCAGRVARPRDRSRRAALAARVAGGRCRRSSCASVRTFLVAEATLHVSSANVGIATAAMFPSFTISGTLGYNASTLGSLFDTASRFWSIGGGSSRRCSWGTLADRAPRRRRGDRPVAGELSLDRADRARRCRRFAARAGP